MNIIPKKKNHIPLFWVKLLKHYAPINSRHKQIIALLFIKSYFSLKKRQCIVTYAWIPNVSSALLGCSS